MAKLKISDLGSRKIALSGLGEIYRPAKGDGTAKPGDLVGIIESTGKVVRTDLGAGTTSETFVGIVDDDPTLAEDTAIPDGQELNLIVPTSGHKYRVKMEDPGGAVLKGAPMGFSDDAGAMEDIATMGTAGVYANLDKSAVDDDVVCEVSWR